MPPVVRTNTLPPTSPHASSNQWQRRVVWITLLALRMYRCQRYNTTVAAAAGAAAATGAGSGLALM